LISAAEAQDIESDVGKAIKSRILLIQNYISGLAGLVDYMEDPLIAAEEEDKLN
jgi:hypothetical protein